jgi:cytochrome c5
MSKLSQKITLSRLSLVLIATASLAACSKPAPQTADPAATERIKPVAEVIKEAAAPAVPAAPAGGAAAPAASGSPDGKKVFDGTCTACHTAGVAGAPKVGDKAAWGPRIGQGKDTLYKHALEGFTGKAGMMPAKGGNAGLADADVKAAVDYMVSQAK